MNPRIVSLCLVLAIAAGSAEAAPVKKPARTSKTAPATTSPYERMLAKEFRDWTEWKTCDTARSKEISEAALRNLEAIGDGIRTRGLHAVVPTPTPDPPPCDKSAWQADALWLTSHDAPKGVTPYVERGQFVFVELHEDASSTAKKKPKP